MTTHIINNNAIKTVYPTTGKNARLYPEQKKQPGKPGLFIV
jgi:hypothetical protein